MLYSGKKVDMAYVFAQKPTKIVITDLSRTSALWMGRIIWGDALDLWKSQCAHDDKAAS